jgi:hypothetical protein
MTELKVLQASQHVETFGLNHVRNSQLSQIIISDFRQFIEVNSTECCAVCAFRALIECDNSHDNYNVRATTFFGERRVWQFN